MGFCAERTNRSNEIAAEPKGVMSTHDGMVNNKVRRLSLLQGNWVSDA